MRARIDTRSPRSSWQQRGGETMKLLTQELLRTIPPLYSQENEADPLCRARLFMPDGAFTWFVIEGSTREKDGCGWGVNCHHRPLTEYEPARDDGVICGNAAPLLVAALGRHKRLRHRCPPLVACGPVTCGNATWAL